MIVRCALRELTRHPLRTLLAVAGVAVAGAMLVDMLMLSNGLQTSFRELLESAGYEVRVSGWARRRCRLAWFLRRFVGKLLSTGRWFKAAATFEGGIDYAVWKLERHTGHKIEVSDKLRRRPWLYAWGEIIRLYRSGTLR